MTIGFLHVRLVELVRERVRNGQITESHLARLTGVSQPHIHNVLKGIRILSTELADQILSELRIEVVDLLVTPDPGPLACSRLVPLLAGWIGPETADFATDRIQGSIFVPSHLAEETEHPVAAWLGDDRHIEPRFALRDLVLIDQSVLARTRIAKCGTYVALTANGPRLRYVRRGGCDIFLPSEKSLHLPADWESVHPDGCPITDVVKGHVVWMSRHLAAGSEPQVYSQENGLMIS